LIVIFFALEKIAQKRARF